MIDGLATATIVASTRIMKKPTIIAHRACHGLSEDGPSVEVTVVPPPTGLAPRPELRRWGKPVWKPVSDNIYSTVVDLNVRSTLRTGPDPDKSAGSPQALIRRRRRPPRQRRGPRPSILKRLRPAEQSGRSPRRTSSPRRARTRHCRGLRR